MKNFLNFLNLFLVTNLVALPALAISGQETTYTQKSYSFIKQSCVDTQKFVKSASTVAARGEVFAWGAALMCAGTNMIAFPAALPEGSLNAFIRTMCLAPYSFLKTMHAWIFNSCNIDDSWIIPTRELYCSVSTHNSFQGQEMRNSSLLAKGLVLTALGGTLLYLGNKYLMKDNKIENLQNRIDELHKQIQALAKQSEQTTEIVTTLSDEPNDLHDCSYFEDITEMQKKYGTALPNKNVEQEIQDIDAEVIARTPPPCQGMLDSDQDTSDSALDEEIEERIAHQKAKALIEMESNRLIPVDQNRIELPEKKD